MSPTSALKSILVLGLILCQNITFADEKFDVVVYGGTSAAVAAAVQVHRMGKSVAIVCPDKHLGGLTSGGLGFTDTGNKAVIGGIAREFYQRVWQHYQSNDAWRWQSRESYGNKGQGTPAIDGSMRTMWIFEPHVAESIFEQFISENKIPVYRNRWLDRDKGVRKEGSKVASIKMLSGEVFEAQLFMDATYEGDLMAASGVAYHVGRESQSKYNEKWAGVQTGVLHHGHHFGKLPPISPYKTPNDPKSGLLPLISDVPPGEFGSEDHRIQAYCYRMCLTQREENRAPFSKPEGYDPANYELLRRVYDAGWRETFEKFDPIPNRKTDTNNHGPVSTDYIGANYDYPEATYERRVEILEAHQRYQMGWLYFIANDPSVPKEVQSEMKKWGLAKDEFVDNEHWPHQIYVREARRMIGKFVMTENELLGRSTIPQSIGMGSYTLDSHNVQRYITPDGYVQNEGDIGVHVPQPYAIALGAVLPKEEQCTNLVVPVCASSSHMAFGSIRMEPVFMILAQSAATVGVMAIERGIPVQHVEYDSLRQRLLKDGQVLEYEANTSNDGIDPTTMQGVIVDDRAAIKKGQWEPSQVNKPFVAHGYLHDGNRRDGSASLTYVTKLPKSGRYEVRLYFPTNENRATNVPVSITSSSGTVTLKVNQKQRDAKLPYTVLSVTEFAQGEVKIEISNDATDGYVVVDAVQMVPLD